MLDSLSASVQLGDIDGPLWRRQTEKCAGGLLRRGDCGFLCIVSSYNIRLFEALWLSVLIMAGSKARWLYAAVTLQRVSQCWWMVEGPTAEQMDTQWGCLRLIRT